MIYDVFYIWYMIYDHVRLCSVLNHPFWNSNPGGLGAPSLALFGPGLGLWKPQQEEIHHRTMTLPD